LPGQRLTYRSNFQPDGWHPDPRAENSFLRFLYDCQAHASHWHKCQAANAHILLLSHFMARRLNDLKTDIDLVRCWFKGKTTAGAHLLRIRVGD
jgi:hypothetical protein